MSSEEQIRARVAKYKEDVVSTFPPHREPRFFIDDVEVLLGTIDELRARVADLEKNPGWFL